MGSPRHETACLEVTLPFFLAILRLKHRLDLPGSASLPLDNLDNLDNLDHRCSQDCLRRPRAVPDAAKGRGADPARPRATCGAQPPLRVS